MKSPYGKLASNEFERAKLFTENRLRQEQRSHGKIAQRMGINVDTWRAERNRIRRGK